jgi:uncharacterized protein YkwD
MTEKIWVLLCGVTVLGIVGPTSRASAADAYDATAERQLVQLINLARAQHGLPPLQEDARLHAAARTHTQFMASQNTLSHQLPGESILLKRMALNGAYFYAAGETAAFNHSADAAQESFMHSPAHRKIILDPQYDAVGVGVVERGGMVWVTEDLAHLQAP